MTILVFGDSITYGAWDHEGGWVARLRKFVDEKVISSEQDYYRKVFNLGVSGNTSAELLARFEREAKVRLKEGEECAVIFAFGANDSQYLLEEKIHRTSPQVFEQNTGALINLARQFTSQILFVGLLPVDEAKVDPMPWAPNKAYRTEFIAQYDAIVKRQCAAAGIEFVDAFSIFSNQDHAALLEDGVHPNDEGHRLTYEAVRDALVKLEWI